MRRAALLLLIAGCATTGPRTPPLYLYVTNWNFDVKDAQLVCTDTGQVLGTPTRGLDLGRKVRSRVPLVGCRNVVVRVTDIGGRTGELVHRPASVGAGESLCVTIAPYLRHSRVENCTEQT